MAKPNVAIPPVPSRMTGDPVEDVQVLYQFLQQFRNQLIVESGIVKRLDKIAALMPMSTEISDPPTKAEVDELKTLINNILAAAKGTGI
jgi:hypothetical protein